jgi:hypothetical protein
LDGSPFNGKVEAFVVPATDTTALFVGDPVMILAGANAAGIPYAKKATAGVKLVGVCTSVDFDRDDLNKRYRLADEERLIFVSTGTDVIYEVQEDSAVATLAAADVWKFADLTAVAGDTTSGTSNVELDSDSAVGTTAQVRILRLRQVPDNEIGANAVWEVIINESEFKANVLAT